MDHKNNNHTIDVHKRQYATSDFERHKKITLEGLRKWERFFISKYLTQPHFPTLEIGCGTGRISFGMEQEFGFSNITATDFVETFIEKAREIASKRNSSIKFKNCNVMDLPFDDNSFQYVVCLGVVLSHLPHRKQRIQALKECHRVLKDGGIVLVNTMNILYKRWYMPFLKILTRLTRIISNPYDYENNSLPRLGSGGKFDPMFLRVDKPVLHYYYPDELVFDLLSSNLTVVSLITTSNSLNNLENERFLNDGANIYIVGKKTKVV